MTACEIKHVDEVKGQLESTKQWASVRDVRVETREGGDNVRIDAKSSDRGKLKAKGVIQELVGSINTQFSISGDLAQKPFKTEYGYATNVKFTQKALDELEIIAQRNELNSKTIEQSTITSEEFNEIFPETADEGIDETEGNAYNVDGEIQNSTDVFYQVPQDREIEEYVASEKAIRDLAARMSDRIGIPVVFESDRSKEYKGKIENGTAYINLAYATLDTPIHEILGHPIIREILKNNKTLYQNLVNEITNTETGRKVLDRIKRDYVYKSAIDFNTTEIKDGEPTSTKEYSKVLEYAKKEGFFNEDPFSIGDFTKERTFSIEGETYKTTIYGDGSSSISKLPKYTLEEQQEEAIVELLGLMTAEKLDNVKDGKLISLLKRLLKEMKQFVRSLINQKEVEIDKLPDNMTLGDIANLLAYSNSKLILPGNEVVYTTPDNQQFKTYSEASKHISELAKSVEDVDLDSIDLEGMNIDIIDKFNNNKQINQVYSDYIQEPGFNVHIVTIIYTDGTTIKHDYDSLSKEQFNFYRDIELNKSQKGALNNFIDRNKEYEQSKEVIEEWKKVNNIQYNPEEVYSRGQEFVSVVGAYSDFDVNLMMQNLLQHIEDNQKAGGEFTISAITKPVDKKVRHLEGGGGKIKFKIYPKSNDIKWAANTDVYSGSVWDAGTKVNKDKKSELLGVSYTKYPSLNNINSVQPNLASIVEDLQHHHNELAISLNFSNFELEVDEDVPYQTKKIIENVNKILQQKRLEQINDFINKLEKEC